MLFFVIRVGEEFSRCRERFRFFGTYIYPWTNSFVPIKMAMIGTESDQNPLRHKIGLNGPDNIFCHVKKLTPDKFQMRNWYPQTWQNVFWWRKTKLQRLNYVIGRHLSEENFLAQAVVFIWRSRLLRERQRLFPCMNDLLPRRADDRHYLLAWSWRNHKYN